MLATKDDMKKILNKMLLVLAVLTITTSCTTNEELTDCNCRKEGILFDIYPDGTRIDRDTWVDDLLTYECDDEGLKGIEEIGIQITKEPIKCISPAPIRYFEWKIICE